MFCSSIHIRNATPIDALKIARVHVESWRTTYRNIVSEEFLENLNVQTRADFWSNILQAKSDNVFVAEIDGELVGFASGGEARDDNEFGGELYAIYVLENHQHKGVGRLLIRAIFHYLKACGYDSVYTWVLAKNNSRNFYQQLGGEFINQKEFEIGGQKLLGIAYGWKDMSRLVENEK